MDALAALAWQIALGADEALEEAPRVRLGAPAAVSGPNPPPAPAVAPTLSPAAVVPPALGPLAAREAAALAEAATTLPELRAAIAGFTGCALRATAANLVFAAGDPDAGLLLIGDAPSEADDRAGTPFAGPDGEYLDRMLASIGLDRARLLLARLVPWRPPGDRPPSPGERAACLPFLLRLIALARPRRLFLLGPLAARDLIGGGAGSRVRRGVWRDLALPLGGTVPALAGPDPAVLRRTPGAGRRQAWADLRMLRRAIEGDLTKS